MALFDSISHTPTAPASQLLCHFPCAMLFCFAIHSSLRYRCVNISVSLPCVRARILGSRSRLPVAKHWCHFVVCHAPALPPQVWRWRIQAPRRGGRAGSGCTSSASWSRTSVLWETGSRSLFGGCLCWVPLSKYLMCEFVLVPSL